MWLYAWIIGPNGEGSKTVDGRKVVRGFKSLPLRLTGPGTLHAGSPVPQGGERKCGRRGTHQQPPGASSATPVQTSSPWPPSR